MAKASEPAALLEVLTPFNGEDGELFKMGDPIEPDHWAVKKWPHFFRPLVLRHPTKRAASPRVEQATAGPGEKRGA